MRIKKKKLCIKKVKKKGIQNVLMNGLIAWVVYKMYVFLSFCGHISFLNIIMQKKEVTYEAVNSFIIAIKCL